MSVKKGNAVKLQQLRYAVEVLRRNLNVSEAADALFTSQPGVSKQIRLLEEELGVQIFVRSGKRIVAVTQAGAAVLERAEQVLRAVQNIKQIGGEFAQGDSGVLTVAATLPLLSFRLPETVAAFAAAFPDVRVQLKQGSPAQVAEMVAGGTADVGVCADAPQDWADVRRADCGSWRYVLLLPDQHVWAAKRDWSLTDVAALPLLTYGFAFDAGGAAARAFQRARLPYSCVLASDDGALLKRYVRLGLGVALLDRAQYDAVSDADLVCVDVGHLFEPCAYQMMLRQGALLRGYMYDFLRLLYADFSRDRIDRLMYSPAVEDFSI